MQKKMIYQFKITLKGIAPFIWRTIQVPADYTFWDLHVAIQDSMGWLDYHLHEFILKNPISQKLDSIGIPENDADKSFIAGWKVPISEYFQSIDTKATYNYDFGDGWSHIISLQAILPKDPNVRYPVCVAGERACPPEDCNGVSGYDNLIEVLAKPRTTEAKEMNAWLKGHAKNYYPYQPDHFEPLKVTFDDPIKRFQIAFQEGC